MCKHWPTGVAGIDVRKQILPLTSASVEETHRKVGSRLCAVKFDKRAELFFSLCFFNKIAKFGGQFSARISSPGIT